MAHLDDPTCPIYRTMDVVGDRWSLLIVRNALRGQTRFSEFRETLGITTDILTRRLGQLVAAGVMEQLPYQQPGQRARYSYHLTEAGLRLKLVLAAMVQWGEEFNPVPGGTAALLARSDGLPVTLAFVSDDGSAEPIDDIYIRPGPESRERW